MSRICSASMSALERRTPVRPVRLCALHFFTLFTTNAHTCTTTSRIKQKYTGDTTTTAAISANTSDSRRRNAPMESSKAALSSSSIGGRGVV